LASLEVGEMCGIIGSVGGRPCQELILDGLQHLEYRGYDSAGIALLEPDGVRTVRAVGKPPAGHVYGWQIEPLPDGACLITNYCDWTNISDELRAKFRWPVVPADRMERSADNLERIATRVVDLAAGRGREARFLRSGLRRRVWLGRRAPRDFAMIVAWLLCSGSRVPRRSGSRSRIRR